MRKAVLERLKRADTPDLVAEAAALRRNCALALFRKYPESAPEAAARTFLEEYFPGADEHQPGRLLHRQWLARPRRRNLVYASSGPGRAVRMDRALLAGGISLQADRSAEVHQALRISSDAAFRQEALRKLP